MRAATADLNCEHSSHILKFKFYNFGLILIYIAFYGAEKRTLRNVVQEYLVSFEISWTYLMKNEVIFRAKGERNVPYIIKKWKADCIGHIWCWNSLLEHVI